MSIKIEGGITIGNKISIIQSGVVYPTKPQAPPDIGTAYTSYVKGTWMDFGSAQSGITTSTQPPTTNLQTAWQLCYAWQYVYFNVNDNWSGFNSYITQSIGSGGSQFWFAQSTTASSNPTIALGQTLGTGADSGTVSAGSFVPSFLSGPTKTITAGYYFLMGIANPGVTFQAAATNKTWYTGGQPWMTMCNTCYYPYDSVIDRTTTPGALGGTGYYEKLDNTAIVQSYIPWQ